MQGGTEADHSPRGGAGGTRGHVSAALSLSVLSRAGSCQGSDSDHCFENMCKISVWTHSAVSTQLHIILE